MVVGLFIGFVALTNDRPKTHYLFASGHIPSISTFYALTLKYKKISSIFPPLAIFLLSLNIFNNWLWVMKHKSHGYMQAGAYMKDFY